jgi:hypothetical protein
LPSTPPLLLISSIAISTVSLSAVSEIAMVPDRECSMPTLMVSAASALNEASPNAAVTAAAESVFMKLRRTIYLLLEG